MADPVSLCNQALARLGTRSTIASLGEQSAEAQACNQFYAQAIQATLQAYDWSFATASVALAATGTAPAPWSYQYAVPRDCVRARRIVGQPAACVAGLLQAGPDVQPPYWIEGERFGALWPRPTPAPSPAFRLGAAPSASGPLVPVIWTNASPATLLYTTGALDPSYWPPLFASAASWQLAYEMAVTLTGKPPLAEEMAKGWTQAIQAARAADSNAAVGGDDYLTDWLAVRF